MKGVTASLALSLTLCACGGDDAAAPGTAGNGGSPSGGTGGTNGGNGGTASSTGGTAGAAGTGGGGGVTRGAVSLHVAPGTGCSIADTFQDFPKRASGHPVSVTDKGQAVEDGSTTADGEPVTVLCDWLGKQTPHTLDAVIKIGPAGAQRTISLGASMELGTTVDSGVSFSCSDLSKSYGSTAQGPCHYQIISMDEATRSVWGSLRCDAFSPSDGSDSCVLAYSYFFFENCTARTAP